MLTMARPVTYNIREVFAHLDENIHNPPVYSTNDPSILKVEQKDWNVTLTPTGKAGDCQLLIRADVRIKG